MTWTWLQWVLLLAPVIFVVIGTGLIALGISLKRGGSGAARVVFPAGVGAYIGGITSLFAWAVDGDAGRMAYVTAFFVLTIAWVSGCLIAAARTWKGTDAAASAPFDMPTQPASTR